ncbi:hypothetical protein VNO77_14120 [Canavalia gladiata]|uniref:Uncharacterized protein n=1 Tax=Canavalia gladiata TaxID=3824 RepID=A0AAN9LXX1_CANGL
MNGEDRSTVLKQETGIASGTQNWVLYLVWLTFGVVAKAPFDFEHTSQPLVPVISRLQKIKNATFRSYKLQALCERVDKDLSAAVFMTARLVPSI